MVGAGRSVPPTDADFVLGITLHAPRQGKSAVVRQRNITMQNGRSAAAAQSLTETVEPPRREKAGTTLLAPCLHITQRLRAERDQSSLPGRNPHASASKREQQRAGCNPHKGICPPAK